MADHSTTNLISKVQLPGSTTQYEIHDAKALHNLADLTALLGDTINLMNFCGTVSTKSSLPASGNAPGDVYYVVDTDSEWIWVDASGTITDAHWEELGSIHDHIHTAELTGTASVTVPTHNISVSGSVTPNVTVTKKYISASAPQVDTTPVAVLPANASFTTTVTPATSQKGVGTVSTKKYKVTVDPDTPAAVSGSGTPAAAITGFGTHPTKNFVTGVDTTKKTVLTGLGTHGTASVISGLGDPTTDKAIKGFGTHTTEKAATALNTTSIVPIKANTPVVASKVTIGDSIKITPTYKNGFSTYFNVSDGLLTITAPVFNEFAVPSITSETVNASLVTSGSATTVATGIKSTANAITALGTPTTFDAVKSFDDVDTTLVSTGYTGAPTAEVIDTITPSTSAALTGLGTPNTTAVLTGVKVSTQPTYTASIVEDSTNGKTFVTGVSKADITISASATTTTSSSTNALSAVSVAAPGLALAGTSSTGAVQVATNAVGAATAHTLTGSVAAQTATGTASVSGDTGGIKSNS